MSPVLSRQQKQQAYGMIEGLAPETLSAVVDLLEAVLDPFARALATAETDDQPVNEEEVRDIAASRKWFKNKQGMPFEQVVSELGLTEEEFQHCATFMDRRSRIAVPLPAEVATLGSARAEAILISL